MMASCSQICLSEIGNRNPRREFEWGDLKKVYDLSVRKYALHEAVPNAEDDCRDFWHLASNCECPSLGSLNRTKVWLANGLFYKIGSAVRSWRVLLTC